MPIIKSAKKRVRVAHKATVRNSKTKRSLRTAVKAFHAALVGVTGGDKKAQATAPALLSDAQSNIDKAAKKGIIHKNKAARQKSQLAARAKAAGAGAPAKAEKAVVAKTAKATKKAAPKAAAKAEKPAVAKKPVAKKAVAKKPAAK